ncbi:YadA C-terminal domain-containing protein [Pasteurella canis]|uniref:YadA C-terminal domain-containing protein n=1 Tax=Pasteurella canis TaxID=753 RepID=UPI000D9635A7|nr:YadA C-terminal domain-containing protein [Pasteurella canis]SPY33073.1 adhesion A [Pasteurella canis]
MNLSKIAVGVAVSLCLVSNIALAESSSSSSSSASAASAPAAPAASAPAAPAASAPAAPAASAPAAPAASSPVAPAASEAPKKTYTKTLEEKAEGKFLELVEELRLRGIDVTQEPPENVEIGEDDAGKLKDAAGYISAFVRLEEIKNKLNRFHIYYPFKLLNDEINENKKQLDENLEGLKIATDTINKVSSEKANIKDVQKNTANIAENKKLITANKTNIDANKTKIDENKSSIAKNVKAISEMNAKIELNHKAIQDVKSQLNSRLDNLNKDLRRGLATQSALTGLFQPYSVGKMNVTAAVGGYQSEKAIAVGSGYRFNDNLAAKVGLSKSLGGSAVSYNMGVNYEF